MKKWNEQYPVNEIIVFENQDFIVANKPPGVKSQDDPNEGESLLAWLQQIKKKNLHLSNRLDRPVSGAVVFSKTKKGNLLLANQKKPSKKYIAIVSKWENPESDLHHYLKRDGTSKKAHLSKEAKSGYKACHIGCTLITQLDRYSVLMITPTTGRFHQIRVQLAHAGYPIRGDVKYGARRANKDRSIDLHALSTSIPSMDKEIFVAPLRTDGLWKTIADLDFFQEIF